MPRGGKRPGAGRRQTRAVVEAGGVEICQEVMNRIHELKRPNVKTFADYLLFVILGASDARINKEGAIAMLYTVFGKPPQRVELSGSGSVTVKIITTAQLPDP